ncbi:MAG: BON domain-containing protein, partial [Anaerolineales bacterium]|nr:BON domain-containing protein [Anaerolineales bacterium]
AKLSSQEQADALDIRVGVLNAVAHLGGSLPSLYLWELAQETAAQVPGIRGVVNRIAAPGAPAPSRIIHLDLPPGCSLKES